MNEEYVVGLLRVSLAETLKVETSVQIIKSIHNTEEALRSPDMEIVKCVVKELRK